MDVVSSRLPPGCHPASSSSSSSSSSSQPHHPALSALERKLVVELREGLTPAEQVQLASEPEDIRHELMLCRFLQNNGHSVPRAIKALRSHLQHRACHRELIAQIRAPLPEGVVDFEESYLLWNSEISVAFPMIQLPAHIGTNDGMPVSCIPLGVLELSVLSQLDSQHLFEWFLSGCEVRCVCLHYQSMCEGRMAKVCEARDCAGINFSQLFAPVSIVKLMSKMGPMMKLGQLYPDLLGIGTMFNWPSRLRVNLLLKLLPEVYRSLMIFATRGHIETAVCSANGLRPDFLVRWTEFLNGGTCNQWQNMSGRNLLISRAIHVTAGACASWNVQLDAPPLEHATAMVIVQFFSSTKPVPTSTKCCKDKVLSVGRPFCGTFEAHVDGVVWLTAELQGSSAAVLAVLSLGSDLEVASAAPKPSWSSRAVAPGPVARSSGRCRWRLSSVVVLLLLVALLAFFRHSVISQLQLRKSSRQLSELS